MSGEVEIIRSNPTEQHLGTYEVGQKPYRSTVRLAWLVNCENMSYG
ncbi:unnamed protein product [Amoebophrya sp. A120]|nr:unnamed protein product [Amoebophrya sp. A120]|eukprot:GSA120T00011753001.1